jgi:hypothetical protein
MVRAGIKQANTRARQAGVAVVARKALRVESSYREDGK